jgi:hypothetical protein
MRRRGIASLEEGISIDEATTRLRARKKESEQTRKRRNIIRVAACLVVCALTSTLCWRAAVARTRAYARRAGVACATPAALWHRADVALLVFADPKLPSLFYPAYEPMSGDYVRSYESSPLCPNQVSRMRHKHVKVRPRPA